MLIYLAALDSGDDKRKFERLYRAYRELMFQVARKVLRRDEDAEDAVHQAFLKLAEEPALLPAEPGPRARALLVTVVERKAIDLWRARQRHPTEELDETTLVYDRPIEPDGTLAAAMAALPPRYREVLLLKFYNGYSNGEIGRLLWLDTANVSQLLHRGKQRLAQELRERGEEP